MPPQFAMALHVSPPTCRSPVAIVPHLASSETTASKPQMRLNPGKGLTVAQASKNMGQKPFAQRRLSLVLNSRGLCSRIRNPSVLHSLPATGADSRSLQSFDFPNRKPWSAPFSSGLHLVPRKGLGLGSFRKRPGVGGSCRKRAGVGSSRRPLTGVVRAVYISPPAAEPEGSLVSPLDEEEEEQRVVSPGFAMPPALKEPLVTWGLLGRLLLQHKARLAVALAAVVGGTVCTLGMPQFAGKFFETLVGIRSGPLSTLLFGLALFYFFEPVFTVLYITNITSAWEDVVARLRTELFTRLLIQKVEFYDRYKVSELTSLLSAEVGHLKAIVTDNVSRDRGLRAVAESFGTLGILWSLAPSLAPVLGILICAISIFAAVYKRTTAPLFLAYNMAQGRITESAGETFGAIRTVRSFGGERRQIGLFNDQVEASRSTGEKLGWFKSYNESVTRIAIYISLMMLYMVGGAKVKAGELPVGIVVAFIGYTFTLTFAVQGLVNSLADLRSAFAAIERINKIGEVGLADAALAVGLDREARGEGVPCDDRPALTNLPAITLANGGAVTGAGARAAPGADGGTMTGVADADSRASTAALEAHPSGHHGERPWSGLVSETVDGGMSREAEEGGASSSGRLGNGASAEAGWAKSSLNGNAAVAAGNGSVAERKEEGGDGCLKLAWSGDVVLEDVHFAYPLRPQIAVLKGLDLTLRSGTVTALVGQSGAGKSTIVQLVSRFYEPTEGRITLAGEDVRNFDKSEWARTVSLVNQEPVLFAMSIADNIAYGAPTCVCSREEIEQAAKLANAHDFIMALPQGYDTMVGERGSLLSGGQRQRVAIARALLKNSPILVLDEATSALDSVSERLVQEAIDRLVKGRTTLVIAHRLSTVQNANQIAVVSTGRIIELGPHSELLAKGGAYAELVATQRLTFE